MKRLDAPETFDGATLAAMPLPAFHEARSGLVATCGRCLASSPIIATASPADAWEQLQALGWTWHVSQYGGSGYCICRECSAKGNDVAAAVKRAHKGRRGK